MRYDKNHSETFFEVDRGDEIDAYIVAGVQFTLDRDNNYGADADGNRGYPRTTILDLHWDAVSKNGIIIEPDEKEKQLITDNLIEQMSDFDYEPETEGDPDSKYEDEMTK